MVRLVLILLAVLLGPVPVCAEKRAVVIGNADYRNAPDLAGSDTAALAEALRQAGFRTADGVDLDAAELRDRLTALAGNDPAPGARIVVLNGRFLHDSGETWFMGTDAQEPDRITADLQGVPLSLVLRLMVGGQPGSILILGTDGQQMPRRDGLESGIGTIAVPTGMAVICGTPELAAQALAGLLRGNSTEQAAAMDPALLLLPGSARDLVLGRQGASSRPEDPMAADRAAWAQAAQTNSPAAYTEYLLRFPRGIFAAAARERLARRGHDASAQSDADAEAWAVAQAANSLAAYMSYLHAFPAGRYAAQATERIEGGASLLPVVPLAPPGQVREPRQKLTPEERVEQAMRLDNGKRAAVQRRLSRLGFDSGAADGIFGQRSRAAIAAWQRANGEAPTGYLSPGQWRLINRQVAYLDGDNGSRDSAFWRQTGATGDPEGLRVYLRRYPYGMHAETARDMLEGRTDPGPQDRPQEDEATWRWARRQGSAAAYETYLERYPQGRRASQARARLQTLRAGTEAARREEAGLGLDSATRRMIEERLIAAGLRTGPVDGEFTDETRAALRRYQATRNLRVTGHVTQETVTRLLSETPRP
ncbi:Putative peptidoglycan binding domain-containing protein [Paracoccus halophilus]|uniref:Putative peptidoglycan binding domain-containing protein n=1 Tax=Paracoccus halophilus TaxID=376733 RepID=A0A1I0TVS0_9RHOB|nr:peptidoglycan-binding protein [Paracoccus halophilus]SFA55036.1 Putative peptidoglycan binding domain-containing protein [Paracoccus halophilus]